MRDELRLAVVAWGIAVAEPEYFSSAVLSTARSVVERAPQTTSLEKCGVAVWSKLHRFDGQRGRAGVKRLERKKAIPIRSEGGINGGEIIARAVR
jgi:hypothetical protein